MEERKHQHCELLCSELSINMDWVERLPDGRLFTIVDHGKPANGRCTVPASQFLFGRISEDNGKTWGAPYFLYEWPDRNVAYMVQGWKSDSKGRIHVFAAAMTVFKPEEDLLDGFVGYVRFDSYRGENPYYSDMPALSRYTGSLNNAIETKSGRLVVPFSTYVKPKFVSNAFYSDDHGTTWKASDDIIVMDTESYNESGALEPVVAEVKPGVLVMLIRTVLDRLWYSVSYDDGSTWSTAKPTKLPSSNSPALLQNMPDGRIFLAWNNCLGHPLVSIRYSAARQCLHGAISYDGLRTIRGARVLVKKEIGDRDNVHNAYATSSMYDEKNILFKHIEVQSKSGASWDFVQARLTLLNPDFLDEADVSDNWGEWVSDLDKTEKGIVMHPTDDNVAHAICNFPYGTKGSISLTTEGELPKTCRVLLSDCYVDRLTFMPNKRTPGYEEVVGEPYMALTPTEAGTWEISWDESNVTLTVNGAVVETLPKRTVGFNHVSVVFDGEGELALTKFSAHSDEMAWDTGIEY